MIKIIAGGKKNQGWELSACSEYEKRLRKPFEIEWQFIEEKKLRKYLNEWPFNAQDFVICCDERGENISSEDFSEKISAALVNAKNVVILIGGAYGFSEETRKRADFVWSFSKLVFPHKLVRVMVIEQVYRAEQIINGRAYHH